MAVLNTFSIEQKLTIAVANSNRFKGLAAQAAKIKFNNVKRDFLKDFDEHKVSQEIKSEGSTGNITGTLGGKGNLFGFIGFYQGSDPIGELRAFLERETLLKTNQVLTTFTRNRINWKFTAERPSLQDIYNATPYPKKWKAGSWVFGIENGIPGLFAYIYWKAGPESRSQQATMAKKPGTDELQVLRSDEFVPTKYVKQLLEEFKDNLKE